MFGKELIDDWNSLFLGRIKDEEVVKAIKNLESIFVKRSDECDALRKQNMQQDLEIGRLLRKIETLENELHQKILREVEDNGQWEDK